MFETLTKAADHDTGRPGKPDFRPGARLTCGHADTLSHVIVSTIIFGTLAGVRAGIPIEILKDGLLEGLDELFKELGINNHAMPQQVINARRAEDYELLN